jgi:hypothetical protein
MGYCLRKKDLSAAKTKPISLCIIKSAKLFAASGAYFTDYIIPLPAF